MTCLLWCIWDFIILKANDWYNKPHDPYIYTDLDLVILSSPVLRMKFTLFKCISLEHTKISIVAHKILTTMILRKWTNKSDIQIGFHVSDWNF